MIRRVGHRHYQVGVGLFLVGAFRDTGKPRFRVHRWQKKDHPWNMGKVRWIWKLLSYWSVYVYRYEH